MREAVALRVTGRVAPSGEGMEGKGREGKGEWSGQEQALFCPGHRQHTGLFVCPLPAEGFN